jgi:hypothetical protein
MLGQSRKFRREGPSAHGLKTADDAVTILARYFPLSAESPEKLRFVLKYLESLKGAHDAPRYPVRSRDEN